MKLLITEKQRDYLMVKASYSDFDKELLNVLMETALEQAEEKDGHLPNTIIDDIKDEDIADVLKALVENGHMEGLNKWRKMVNNDKMKDIDFEDLMYIAQWIDGSKMNQNPPSVTVPDFVIELVKELS